MAYYNGKKILLKLEGEGGGAGNWDELEGKPFETVGETLEVDEDGVLNVSEDILRAIWDLEIAVDAMTTETWRFTLDDGTTVTKRVYINNPPKMVLNNGN